MTCIKRWVIPVGTLILFFIITPIAEAHVTVHPSQSETNAYEKYTVRIPVEKDAQTIKVKLEVPDDINLVSVSPVDDWDYKLKKDKNDTIQSVTWTAKKDGIGPNEFIEFPFIGANPDKPSELSWKAYQTYDDDSVVEWVGKPDADEPASVTKVVDTEDNASNNNEAPSQNENDQTSVNNAQAPTNTTSLLPIVLASIAILLALISLFRKRH